jgi:hypothetical protein
MMHVWVYEKVSMHVRNRFKDYIHTYLKIEGSCERDTSA